MRRRAGSNARRAVAEWRLRCGRRAPRPVNETTLKTSKAGLARRRAALTRTVVQRALQRSTAQHLEADRAKLWHPYAATPGAPCLPVKRAAGVRLELEDGTQLIDGMSSWWAAVHGYGVPELDRAVTDQIGAMSHVMFGGLTHRPAVALGELLVACTPEGLDRVFLADSGSVAVEVALKMSAQYWRGFGRPDKCKFVALKGGYHGDTLGAMSVSDPATGRHRAFGSMVPSHHFVPRPPPRGADCGPALEALETLLMEHQDSLAALILEPLVQGAGGMHFYDAGYLRGARALCDRHDVLLICDEIATGFGRTGSWFACDEADIAPDILCLGKALTGGYMTMGATLATEAVATGVCAAPPDADALPLMHGPTFMGNPLACAVALASVSKLLKHGWWRRVHAIEGQLCEGLQPCVALAAVKDVRVKGAIGVVELYEPLDAAKVAAAGPSLGVWLRPFGTRLYTMPPFACESNDVAQICAAVHHVASNAGDYL
jgi:adenosylmethionine-8-amino-7-oxononanoate aminotransferase